MKPPALAQPLDRPCQQGRLRKPEQRSDALNQIPDTVGVEGTQAGDWRYRGFHESIEISVFTENSAIIGEVALPCHLAAKLGRQDDKSFMGQQLS